MTDQKQPKAYINGNERKVTILDDGLVEVHYTDSDISEMKSTATNPDSQRPITVITYEVNFDA